MKRFEDIPKYRYMCVHASMCVCVCVLCMGVCV